MTVAARDRFIPTLATLVATLAACAYDAPSLDCAVTCTTSRDCPDGLSCSASERLCRAAAPTLMTCASMIAGDGGTADTTSNLVGWWKFDEESGITTADSSGNGNTGTLQNSPRWTVGKLGGALAFGGNSYVSVADSPSLQLGGTNIVTLAAWIKRSTAYATGSIVEKASTSGGYTLAIGITPCAANQLKATKFSIVDICLGAVPNDTNWHHIALVFSSAGVTGYIDGVRDAIADDSQDFASSTAPMTFGVLFGGSIDDIRIYKRALSATDVMALVEEAPGAR